MNGCSSCGFQSGASYQYSPLSTSTLPSLLTSAVATPSDRNLVSSTVFFQEMFEAVGGSAEIAGTAATAATATAASAGSNRNMGRLLRAGGWRRLWGPTPPPASNMSKPGRAP